ncbi:retrovirus-related Pol polyprotein from transposon 297 [Trichonephila clavipes]|nr:retrovirus-related Pol polyprotein from transposon 297 [Trichonephila clavipes]
MSALDLRSGYFQMAVNPSDIVKTAFVTKNGSYSFPRMPFGLSVAAPNFQKAIDIILKPVIWKFVNVYMDEVILLSPSFTQNIKHFKEVFRLLHEAGLALNKDKCKFGCEEFKYLGLIINKEGIKTDETKVQAIVEMKTPRNSKEVSNFLGMSQWREMRVYIPKSLRNEIMREFHDKPLAGHFGRFKTYHKIRDVCYFPYMRKFIDQYVSTCHMYQVNNYKNALPAGRLIPIVSNCPNEIVTLDLLGPYPVSRKLVMVSDGTEFAVGDIERLFEEARRNTKAKHEKWEKYYNRHRRDMQIKVRIYFYRKCDETEIGTGSSDNGSLRDAFSCFDRVPRRSNESQDGKKKGSDEKRELEGKGLRFRNDQGEKHTNKTNKRGPLVRSIPSSWSEEGRMIKKKAKRKDSAIKDQMNLGREDQKGRNSRREETVAPTTSGYNLRPRNGKREESRSNIERKTQQGGTIRSRKGRERNDSPYIEERTRSSNKNARRGGDQQRQDQERRGTCTKKSLSLEVLVGNANYKS